MNITKENIDALNAVVKVDIVADDYQAKVAGLLADYRKKADVPGFRKGHVPMGMIKKKYGKSIMIDEVNKLLQESLNKFLADEKLDILGNPIPRMTENFDWDAEVFSFEFELGLAPVFDVNLDAKKKVTKYNIVATEELLDEEVKNIQKRYGKMIPQEEALVDSNVTATFVNEENEINKKSTFLVKDLKGKKNEKKVIGAKVGDVIELETKGLFEDNNKLEHILGVSNDASQDLNVTVSVTIEEITKTELAELDKELFDKLFSDGSVTSVTELKAKIKIDAEKQFEQQGDQQLLNAITEYLVENTKFDLPEKFLKKWMQTAGENKLNEEEAKVEYEKSEKGLRYQLIESKLIENNDIKIDANQIKSFSKELIKTQMMQYGQANPDEKELESISQRILSNKEEVKRISDQLLSQKLISLFKSELKFKVKKVSYEKFIEMAYAKK